MGWSLAPGAGFFLLVQTPDYRFDGPLLHKYGFHTELTGEEDEAGPRARTTALLDPPIEIVAICPRREVHEKCLRAAGFSELTWVPLEVSDAGVRSSARTTGSLPHQPAAGDAALPRLRADGTSRPSDPHNRTTRTGAGPPAVGLVAERTRRANERGRGRGHAPPRKPGTGCPTAWGFLVSVPWPLSKPPPRPAPPAAP